MTSYMSDNFDRFGNYLFIWLMHSSICNTKECWHITPVIKNEIGIINIIYEDFIISEIYNVNTFILESLF